MAGKKRRTNSTAKVSEANEAGASTKMARGLSLILLSHILPYRFANRFQLPVDPLAVPELLANVLSFATQSTLASCALACKSWSDVALDILWRNLDSVFPLLEMLVGMELLGGLDFPSPNSLQVSPRTTLALFPH